MYFYNSCIREINDQIYFCHNMCKYYRLPIFNLNETSKVICNYSHIELKSAIAEGFDYLKFHENKEKIFEFYEKFYYNENIKNKYNSLENLKREMTFRVDIVNQLSRLRNASMMEDAVFENNKLFFKFSNLLEYKIFFYIYDTNFISFFCYDLEIIKDNKYLKKVESRLRQYVNNLNEELFNIQINFDSDCIDLRLYEMKNVLRNFNRRYINIELFYYTLKYLKEYTENKIKLRTNIIIDKNLFVLKLNNEVKTEEFRIEIKIEEDSEYFYIYCSHDLLDEINMIYVHNVSLKYQFYQLTNISIEKIIINKIKQYNK